MGTGASRTAIGAPSAVHQLDHASAGFGDHLENSPGTQSTQAWNADALVERKFCRYLEAVNRYRGGGLALQGRYREPGQDQRAHRTGGGTATTAQAAFVQAQQVLFKVDRLRRAGILASPAAGVTRGPHRQACILEHSQGMIWQQRLEIVCSKSAV